MRRNGSAAEDTRPLSWLECSSLSVSSESVAGRANSPVRGCVRSTSRSTLERPKVLDSLQRPRRCVAAAAGPVDATALLWFRLRRAELYSGFPIHQGHEHPTPSHLPTLGRLEVGDWLTRSRPLGPAGVGFAWLRQSLSPSPGRSAGLESALGRDANPAFPGTCSCLPFVAGTQSKPFVNPQRDQQQITSDQRQRLGQRQSSYIFWRRKDNWREHCSQHVERSCRSPVVEHDQRSQRSNPKHKLGAQHRAERDERQHREPDCLDQRAARQDRQTEQTTRTPQMTLLATERAAAPGP